MGRPTLPVDDLFEELGETPVRDREELLFERASFELETGRKRRGVYAKALTAADGDRDRAGARYLRLRVDQLESEFEAWEAERVEEERDLARRAEASADFVRTLLAVALIVFGLVAILSWS